MAPSSKNTEPLWFKDAIIYEVSVRAFYDSNGDGIGDFQGLIHKLDYLEDLGINTIWLLPFFPSPLKDDGFDVTEHCDIHPDYGTLADFKLLLKEAHRRNIRVITELILNHTSDQHPWFQKSRRARSGCAPPSAPGSWARRGSSPSIRIRSGCRSRISSERRR